MCGRFTLTISNKEQLQKICKAPLPTGFDYRPRFNIAPGQLHPVIINDNGSHKMIPAVFGHKGSKMIINIKYETVAKNKYRPSLTCIIPADGFYEWKRENNISIPYWFYIKNMQVFFMAGVLFYEQNKFSFAVITGPSQGVVKDIHSRMPVLSPNADTLSVWIKTGEIPPIRSLKADLNKRCVADLVNSTKNDGPECILPAAHKQVSLF